MKYQAWVRSLYIQNFRRLSVCVLFLAMAMSMNYMTIGWLTFEITNSALMTTLASSMGAAPFLLIGPFAGVIADRLNRVVLLRIIITLFATISGMMGLVLLNQVAQYWQILVYAALAGFSSVFLWTIRNTLSYDITGSKLALNGIALIGVSMQIGLFFGPLLAGFILSLFGAGVNFLVVSLFASSSAVCALSISKNVHKKKDQPQLRFLAVYKNVWAMLKDEKTILILIIAATLTELFGFSPLSILPVIAKEVLGLGSLGLGVLMSTRQVAGILGLAILARNNDYRRRGALILIIMASTGLCLISLILSNNTLYYMSLLSLASASCVCIESLIGALIQDNVLDHQRGKATGLWCLSLGTAPVGHIGLGSLVGLVGIQLTLFLTGAALFFSTIILAAVSRTARRLN